MDLVTRLLYLLAFLGGTALLMLVFWLVSRYVKNRELAIPNPVEADGEVVDIVPIQGISIYTIFPFLGKDGPKYHPVIKFKLDKERSVKFRNRKGFDEHTYIVGQKVRIQYSQDNPLTASIKEI